MEDNTPESNSNAPLYYYLQFHEEQGWHHGLSTNGAGENFDWHNILDEPLPSHQISTLTYLLDKLPIEKNIKSLRIAAEEAMDFWREMWKAESK